MEKTIRDLRMAFSLSVVLLVAAILLLATSSGATYNHSAGDFKYAPSGLLLVGLTTILFFLYCLYKVIFMQAPEESIISSRLSFVVKFLGLYYLLLAWALVATFAYFSIHASAIFLPLFFFMAFLVCLSLAFSYSIYFVSVKDDCYLVYSFFGLKARLEVNSTSVTNEFLFLRLGKSYRFLRKLTTL